MKKRLALVACLGPSVGPWVRTRNNETGVRVLNLGEGERIVVDTEVYGLPQDPFIFDCNGTFSIQPFSRIRFTKEGDCHKLTNVELVSGAL